MTSLYSLTSVFHMSGEKKFNLGNSFNRVKGPDIQYEIPPKGSV